MNHELEVCKETVVANLSYNSSICLEGLRKPTKTLSKDSRSLDQDLNQIHPYNEARVLTIRPRRSVYKKDLTPMWSLIVELNSTSVV
jgi:hypothetical protein